MKLVLYLGMIIKKKLYFFYIFFSRVRLYLFTKLLVQFDSLSDDVGFSFLSFSSILLVFETNFDKTT